MTEQNIFAGIFNVSFEGALAQLVDQKIAASVANTEAIASLVEQRITAYNDTFMDTTAGDEVKAAISAGSEQRTEDQIQEALDVYDPTGHYSFDGYVDKLIEDYDIDSKIESYLDGADYVTTSRLTDEVTSAIDDYDLSEKISDAIGDHDFSDDVESAIDDYDMSDKVKLVIEESSVIQDAVRTYMDSYMGSQEFSDKLYGLVKSAIKDVITSNL